MVKNKGVIKELYSEIENPEEKIIQLHFDTNIPFDELVSFYNDEPDWDWVEHDDYSMIIDRLFDVSGAPDSYDDDGERYDVRPIGGNMYEIDLYYYNGGTNMEELIGSYLEKEDTVVTQTRIIAAAIHKNGVVFTGDRHGHIIKDMVTVGFLKDINKDYVSGEEQGFIDSNNIYWPRDEAWHVALAAGQIKSSHGTLYSEDLW